MMPYVRFSRLIVGKARGIYGNPSAMTLSWRYFNTLSCYLQSFKALHCLVSDLQQFATNRPNLLQIYFKQNFIQGNHNMARPWQQLQFMQLLRLIELLQMKKICTEFASHLRWYTLGISHDFIELLFRWPTFIITLASPPLLLLYKSYSYLGF